MAMYIEEHVEVEVDEGDMIDHLEGQGWYIYDEDMDLFPRLEKEQIEILIELVDERGYTPGSPLYNLREELARAFS
jgi:hypothetical protein